MLKYTYQLRLLSPTFLGDASQKGVWGPLPWAEEGETPAPPWLTESASTGRLPQIIDRYDGSDARNNMNLAAARGEA